MSATFPDRSPPVASDTPSDAPCDTPPGLAAAPHGLWQDLSHMLLRHRTRVATAIVFLVLAKMASVAVPLVLKGIVDTLSRPESVQFVPLALLGGYALLRFMGTLLTEMRDLLISRLTQRAIGDYALGVFNHLHRLGARFHARRRIGALLPEIDRGTTGIAFLLGVGLLTVLPTLIEISRYWALSSAATAGGMA